MAFLIGLWVGAIFGFFITALCTSGGDDGWKE